ncbi:hypothetical protein LINPERHAP1_LOCUS34782 [Linum perenne]
MNLSRTLMIAMITLSMVFTTSLAAEPRTKHEFKSLQTLMSVKHDPKATMESVKADAAIQTLCQSKDNPTKCLDFLGNAPNADLAYVVKSDVSVLRTLLREGSFLVQRPVPELKKSFEACSGDIDKAVKMLDEASTACEGTPEGSKVVTPLLHVTTYLRLCDKSFHGTPDIARKYNVKDLCEEAIEATLKVMAVANRIK